MGKVAGSDPAPSRARKGFVRLLWGDFGRAPKPYIASLRPAALPARRRLCRLMQGARRRVPSGLLPEEEPPLPRAFLLPSGGGARPRDPRVSPLSPSRPRPPSRVTRGGCGRARRGAGEGVPGRGGWGALGVQHPKSPPPAPPKSPPVPRSRCRVGGAAGDGFEPAGGGLGSGGEANPLRRN